jgi:CubicO group peptidase (beta-lactamase class C family)
MKVRILVLATVFVVATLVAPAVRAQGAAVTLDRDAVVAGIDAVAEGSIRRRGTPGMSVGVALGGETLLTRGYGLADLENGVPATEGTVYRIGSVTKQFTAVATMMLVDSGQLELDAPLDRFLPDYPSGGRTVTIEHLLTHTSGIASYTSQPAFRETIPLELSHEELLALFQDVPFDFEPGAGWNYSNSGYYLLGMIIERVTGREYADFLREEIALPLDLRSTRYGDVRPIIPNRARGYDPDGEGGFVNCAPMGMNAPGAAGALVSTVIDLLAWQRALDEHRIVSAEAYDRMRTPARLADGRETDYGFGLSIGELDGHRRVSHGGGINGFTSHLARFPDEELTVVVLTNTVAAEAENATTAIARLVLGELAGDEAAPAEAR